MASLLVNTAQTRIVIDAQMRECYHRLITVIGNLVYKYYHHNLTWASFVNYQYGTDESVDELDDNDDTKISDDKKVVTFGDVNLYWARANASFCKEVYASFSNASYIYSLKFKYNTSNYIWLGFRIGKSYIYVFRIHNDPKQQRVVMTNQYSNDNPSFYYSDCVDVGHTLLQREATVNDVVQIKIKRKGSYIAYNGAHATRYEFDCDSSWEICDDAKEQYLIVGGSGISCKIIAYEVTDLL